jgi:hypothetical protein
VVVKKIPQFGINKSATITTKKKRGDFNKPAKSQGA